MWNSVRVRLTLWNVVILGVVLGGFGLAMSYAVQVNQAAAIDRHLASRARVFSHRGPRFNGGPPGPRFPLGPPEGEPRGPQPPMEPPAGDTLRSPGEPAPNRPGEAVLLRAPGVAPRPAAPSPGLPREPDDPRSLFEPRGPRGGPGGAGGRGGPGLGPGMGMGPGMGPNVRFWLNNPDDELQLERPRIFDRDGRGIGPFRDEVPFDAVSLAPALQGVHTYSTVMLGSRRVRVLSVPVRSGEEIIGVAQVAQSLGEVQRLAESQMRTLMLLLPLALLVAGAGGLFLTNRALLPVRRVTQAAAQIGAEDLSRRLEVQGKDEMAELAYTFNGMIARLEHSFQESAEAYRRLEAAYEEQRRFTGDASHELRTPLARIKGSSSLALCGPADLEEYREALTVIDEAADAMGRVVQDLLLLARSDSGQLDVRLEDVSLQRLMRSALARLPEEGAPIRVSIPEGLALRGDADHLARVLVNLLQNARRHTPSTGEIRVIAALEGNRVRLTVADTGEGIAPEHLPHLCERFYRVDAARTGAQGGTGLGLAIVRSIVEAHGGSLTIESEIGKGTRVVLILPASPHR